MVCVYDLWGFDPVYDLVIDEIHCLGLKLQARISNLEYSIQMADDVARHSTLDCCWYKWAFSSISQRTNYQSKAVM